MANNRSWLRLAEYVSLAGAGLGSIVAVVSQQAIYGLAPVSLSLLLNLINRHRLEQLIQQRHPSSDQIEQLQSAIASLSLVNPQSDQNALNLVSREELTSIVSQVEALNERQNGLRLSLIPLQSQIDDLIQQFNQRPELEQIESLALVITALKQCIDELPQPKSQQPSAKLHLQVERLEKAIAQMQQQLSEQ